MQFSSIPSAALVQFEPSILTQFEDIVEEDIIENEFNNLDEADDSEPKLSTIDANSLTLQDLLHEMERRGIHPRGFFDDDAKTLQASLDKEHEDSLKLKHRERKEKMELERAEKKVRRRKALTDESIREENQEVDSDVNFRNWHSIILAGKVPLRCRIEVNNVSARTLSRHLYYNTQIISLDVSCLNLPDLSGAYLARALKNNKTLKKLELGENNFSVKTSVTLSESLRVNNTLMHLSIDSNPLTSKNQVKVVDALANMVRFNKSLRYLNIWRCNIGFEGGQLLADAIKDNNLLTDMEFGYNYFNHADIGTLKLCLRRNRKLEKERVTEKHKNGMIRLKEDIEKKKAEENRQKELKDQKWIGEQKLDRNEDRRAEIERARAQKRILEAERQKELEQKRMEEEQKAKRTKKKKSKKKK